MIIYIAQIDHAIEGEIAFPTLEEARAERNPGTWIRKVTIPRRLTRELVCAIYNRQSYAEKQEEVE